MTQELKIKVKECLLYLKETDWVEIEQIKVDLGLVEPFPEGSTKPLHVEHRRKVRAFLAENLVTYEDPLNNHLIKIPLLP
jgi:hypothetical protein